MNFLNAIKHAAIGYGIRRQGWANNLHLTHNGELKWVGQTMKCSMLGGDTAWDLNKGDITALDWETVTE